MKKILLISLACAGLISSCAATVPKELASAREAYRRAASGPTARIAQAELHVANQALATAEQSFATEPDSYRTRDLAYVAQRKSELAMAVGSISAEQQRQAVSRDEYDATQTLIVAQTKQDLGETRTALAESETSGDATEKSLSQTRTALAASQATGTATRNDLTQTRAALVASEHSGEVTAVQLSAEQDARVAAEKRAAIAQAALAKLAAIKDEPRGLVITLSGSVLFGSNQAALLPEARVRLDQVAEVLLATRERNVVIEGHTDSQGSDAHNQDLSQRRADSVRDYLVSREYQADRIQARGVGETRPIADNGNAEGRANNRRVEIIIEREAHSSNR